MACPSSILQRIGADAQVVGEVLRQYVSERTVGQIEILSLRDIEVLQRGAAAYCPFECVCGENIYDEVYDGVMGQWQERAEALDSVWMLLLISLTAREIVWNMRGLTEYQAPLRWMLVNKLGGENFVTARGELESWLQWSRCSTQGWDDASLRREFGELIGPFD